MDFAALLVAVVGLAVAALSLGWQIASWLLSAGRVRPRLRHGILTPGGLFSALVTESGAPADLASITEQGFIGSEVLAVQVANIGRGPVTVERFEVVLRGGKVSFVPHGDAIGPALPTRMEPGTSETWMVKMETVRAFVHASQVLTPGRRRVGMTVELATGQKRSTRHAIEVVA